MPTSAAEVTVIGGGPAGSSAAIAAALDGAAIDLYEKSKLPRHKVCGEFLSPEILPLLDKLGLATAFVDERPAPITRLLLRFGEKEKCAPLPERAYGLSRFAFDKLLFDRAAILLRPPECAGHTVIAHGRRHAAPPNSRGT